MLLYFDGKGLFIKSCESNKVACVEVLLKYGFDYIDVLGNTGTISAARNGAILTLKILLERNIDIDTPNRFGMTPIMSATEKLQINAMKLLLSKKDSIKSHSLSGALHQLCSKCKYPLAYMAAKILLNAGAPVDRKSIFFKKHFPSNRVLRIIMIAGKYIDPTTVSAPTLSDWCRSVIRNTLIDSNQQMNLFKLIPKLPTPKPLMSYLLYYESVEDDNIKNNENDI